MHQDEMRLTDIQNKLQFPYLGSPCNRNLCRSPRARGVTLIDGAPLLLNNPHWTSPRLYIHGLAECPHFGRVESDPVLVRFNV